MPRQQNSWSCAACALAWIQRATGISESASEMSAIQDIGFPENINATYGLMRGSGIQLQIELEDDNQPTRQKWVTFDELYAIAEHTTGMIAGGSWYHWVSIRGVSNDSIWIANSAPGYRGVYDVLNRTDFNRLGPFNCVYLI